MQYALVEGARQEASPGAKGLCPTCGAAMVAKCGPRVIHHWAHAGRRNCDPWWENDELLEIRREEQFYDLMEQQKRERQVLIAKLDKQNSWNLVAEFIAMREQENGRPVSKEDDMDQEWNEFLLYKLRLPANVKAYLLYQFVRSLLPFSAFRRPPVHSIWVAPTAAEVLATDGPDHT